MSASPQYAAIPKLGFARISTANTNLDGTGTLGNVLTPGGTKGARLRGVSIVAIGVTTDGMVRLFLHDGTNARLWKEVKVAAITPSATVAAFSAYLNEYTHPELFPLVLPVGYSLRASTHKAESFDVIAEGPDL